MRNLASLQPTYDLDCLSVSAETPNPCKSAKAASASLRTRTFRSCSQGRRRRVCTLEKQLGLGFRGRLTHQKPLGFRVAGLRLFQEGLKFSSFSNYPVFACGSDGALLLG